MATQGNAEGISGPAPRGRLRQLVALGVILAGAALGTLTGARLIRPEHLVRIPSSWTAVVIEPGCSYSQKLIGLDREARKEDSAAREIVLLPTRPGEGVKEMCRAEKQALAASGQPWLFMFSDPVLCRALGAHAAELQKKHTGVGYPYFVRGGDVVGEGLSKESLAALGGYGEALLSTANAAGLLK